MRATAGPATVGTDPAVLRFGLGLHAGMQRAHGTGLADDVIGSRDFLTLSG